MLTQSKRYERLSPQDASFLVFEKPDLHMHVGMLAFFESGSFRLDSGAIDVRKFQRYVSSRLSLVPRCRQKLAYIPVVRQPVWVDDDAFDIERHVREETLDARGEDALQRLASEIFSVQLDRGRPLWEMTLVQGLGDPDRFAVICKVHHSVVDGIAAIDFMGALLTPDPVDEIEALLPHRHRPAPGGLQLLLDEVLRWARGVCAMPQAVHRLASRAEARALLRTRATALVRMIARGVRGTSPSPLREAAQARRSFAWMATSRKDERSIRSRLGGSRDDVVVATATGAVRGYLERHGAETRRLRVRALAPMSVRSRAERGRLGNRVSLLILDLPVGEREASRRLARVRDNAIALKASSQAQGVEALLKIDRVTGTLAQSLTMAVATHFGSYNVLITNVPGPPVPLYALDAKLQAIYPMGPIFDGHHIAIAAFTYLDMVHWGVQYGGEDPAEAQRIVANLRESFGDLVAASEGAPARVRIVEPRTPDAGLEVVAATGA